MHRDICWLPSISSKARSNKRQAACFPVDGPGSPDHHHSWRRSRQLRPPAWQRQRNHWPALPQSRLHPQPGGRRQRHPTRRHQRPQQQCRTPEAAAALLHSPAAARRQQHRTWVELLRVHCSQQWRHRQPQPAAPRQPLPAGPTAAPAEPWRRQHRSRSEPGSLLWQLLAGRQQRYSQWAPVRNQ